MSVAHPCGKRCGSSRQTVYSRCSRGGEPSSAARIRQRFGLVNAIAFDLSNACAGTFTTLMIVDAFIREGVIKRAMVVSGEYISQLGRNAARDIRTIQDDQLASLTLGDAGAAAILERAPEGAPGIEVAGFTTLAEHSRLCLAFPAKEAPGVSMYSDARTLQEVGIEDTVPLLREALDPVVDLRLIDPNSPLPGRGSGARFPMNSEP